MSCQNPSAAEPTVWSAIHVRHLARLQGMATFQMQPSWCFPSKRAMEKNPRVLPHHSLNWLVHVGIHFLPSTISQFLAAASSRKAEWEGLFEVPFKDGWLQARNMKLFRFVTLTGQICDLKPPTRFPENRITWPGKPACPDRRQSTLVTPRHAWNPLVPCPQAGFPWLLGIAIQVSNCALVSLEVMSSIRITAGPLAAQKSQAATCHPRRHTSACWCLQTPAGLVQLGWPMGTSHRTIMDFFECWGIDDYPSMWDNHVCMFIYIYTYIYIYYIYIYVHTYIHTYIHNIT